MNFKRFCTALCWAFTALFNVVIMTGFYSTFIGFSIIAIYIGAWMIWMLVEMRVVPVNYTQLNPGWNLPEDNYKTGANNCIMSFCIAYLVFVYPIVLYYNRFAVMFLTAGWAALLYANRIVWKYNYKRKGSISQ